MSELNQIVAATNGNKSKFDREVNKIYKKVQNIDLFDGLTRTYQPLDIDDNNLSPEKKNPQYSVRQAIEEVTDSLTSLFDIVANQEYGNYLAKADVVIGNQIILKDVPVAYLLFIEDRLTDIYNFVNTLPTLDLAFNWSWSDVDNCFESEATKEQPAQVETYSENVKVGEWLVKKFSGAIPASEKTTILQRVSALQDAVKFAVMFGISQVDSVNVSRPLFNYMFDGATTE